MYCEEEWFQILLLLTHHQIAGMGHSTVTCIDVQKYDLLKIIGAKLVQISADLLPEK